MKLDVMRQKQRKVKRLALAASQAQGIPGLSHQCTTNEPQ